MRDKLIVLVIVNLLLISCYNYDPRVDIKQQGIIYNAINKLPIVNVKIQLWKKTGGFWAQKPVIITIEQEVYTDQEGRYFIDYLGTGGCTNYHIECYAEFYIPLDHGEVRCTGQLEIIDFPLSPLYENK